MNRHQRLEDKYRMIVSRVPPHLHSFMIEESRRQGKSMAFLLSELIERAKRKREKEIR